MAASAGKLPVKFNESARQKFSQVIKIGQTLDMLYLVYWGFVNIARIYRIESQSLKALEILLVLRKYPVEYKEAQDECDLLLADLQAEVPDWQIEAVRQQVESNTLRDQTLARLLERAVERSPS